MAFDHDFPPGYKFRPLDDEIISYLGYKLLGRPLPYDPVVTIDGAYDIEPEQLPLGNNNERLVQNEWYFYTTRPHKNHYLTSNGYYIATPMDEPVIHNDLVVGFKRILNFYLGSPPSGIPTNWSVFEFRANPGLIPAEKAFTLVMCKIIFTPILSRTEMDELQGKRLHLQSRL